eukprot:2166814-Amphidinium_carterae.2
MKPCAQSKQQVASALSPNTVNADEVARHRHTATTENTASPNEQVGKQPRLGTLFRTHDASARTRRNNSCAQSEHSESRQCCKNTYKTAMQGKAWHQKHHDQSKRKRSDWGNACIPTIITCSHVHNQDTNMHAYSVDISKLQGAQRDRGYIACGLKPSNNKHTDNQSTKCDG